MRSRRIGTRIERDLRNPELWAFVTASPTPEATHISLLLDTLADESRLRVRADGRCSIPSRPSVSGSSRRPLRTFWNTVQ